MSCPVGKGVEGSRLTLVDTLKTVGIKSRAGSGGGASAEHCGIHDRKHMFHNFSS